MNSDIISAGDHLQQEYGDLLGGAPDGATLAVVSVLDRQRAVVPPAELSARAGSIWLQAARPAASTRRPWRRSGFLVAVLALCLLTVGATVAATNILNLGKPTNTVSTNPYFPLDNFHRLKPHHGVAIPTGLTLYYAPVSPFDDVEEWPVMKALEQFGTLKGVRPEAPICFPNAVGRAGGPTVTVCHPPSFDLTHARFASRYLPARFLRVTDEKGACIVGKLAKTDWKVLVTYGGVNLRNRKEFCRSWNDPMKYPGLTYRPPALLIGPYEQNGSQLLHYGDFEAAAPLPPSVPPDTIPPLTGLSFNAVQADLAAGTNPPGSPLVTEVNAEANIITALICQSDGGRPKSICSREVIQHIRKHVK